MEFLPYVGAIAAVLTIGSTAFSFAVRAEVRQAKAETDLAIANAVRERIVALAELRQWAGENFASRASINARLDKLEVDIMRRIDKLDEKFDRFAERTGHGHDD